MTEGINFMDLYNSSPEVRTHVGKTLSKFPRSSFAVEGHLGSTWDSGHCMYYGHCAPCSKKIDIASVNKYLDLALIQENVPETLKNHYALLEHHASECIGCGACLKNCPFGVDVMNKMKTGGPTVWRLKYQRFFFGAEIGSGMNSGG